MHLNLQPWNPVDSSEDDDYPGDAPSESESVHFGIEAPEDNHQNDLDEEVEVALEVQSNPQTEEVTVEKDATEEVILTHQHLNPVENMVSLEFDLIQSCIEDEDLVLKALETIFTYNETVLSSLSLLTTGIAIISLLRKYSTLFCGNILDPHLDNISSMKQEKCDDIKNIKASNSPKLKKSNSVSKKATKKKKQKSEASGVRYSCDQCDASFAQKMASNFTKHKSMKGLHINVIYVIDPHSLKQVTSKNTKHLYMKELVINVINVVLKHLTQVILKNTKHQFMKGLDIHVINVMLLSLMQIASKHTVHLYIKELYTFVMNAVIKHLTQVILDNIKHQCTKELNISVTFVMLYHSLKHLTSENIKHLYMKELDIHVTFVMQSHSLNHVVSEYIKHLHMKE